MNYSFSGKPWAPVKFTPPLTPDFESAGPELITLLEKYYTLKTGNKIKLDDYQKCLLCHVLERYPVDHPDSFKAGQLRYRQVVISMGRQNGKTELAAFLMFYGLYKHTKGAEVVGIAPKVDQANVLYQRLAFAIKNSPALSKKVKTSQTRGIRFKDNSGGYQIKASGSDKLQGLPVTFGVADELHILDEGSWDALVVGQRAQRKSMMVGITTAGDEGSTLLKRLYAQGLDAITGADERFGFFLWEAPDGTTIEDEDAMKAANPAVCEGRINLSEAIASTKKQPLGDQERYGLNKFVTALSGWVSVSEWQGLSDSHNFITPGDKDIVFSVDKYSDNEYVTICANKKDDEGFIHTEIWETLVRPSLEGVRDKLVFLNRNHRGSVVVIDAQTFKGLTKMLEDKNVKLIKLFSNDIATASSVVRSLITDKRIKHDHNQIYATQVPRGIPNVFGDQWAVSRKKTIGHSDALFAMIIGVYQTEIAKEKTRGIYL